MKVYVDGRLYDSEKEPIILVFSSEQDRIAHANNITNMEPKEDIRLYAAFPSNVFGMSKLMAYVYRLVKGL